MGEIKELEEARGKIVGILDAYDLMASDSELGEFLDKAAMKQTRINQIFNLKGADWKIAIVGNWSYTNPDGNKYAQVIWQAGE